MLLAVAGADSSGSGSRSVSGRPWTPATERALRRLTHVDIAASVQRVDAAGRELVLRVLVTPRGNLSEAGGISPTETLTLQTSASVRGDLKFHAHSRIATVDVPVTLTAGSITDYPFNAYDAHWSSVPWRAARPYPSA